MSALLPDTPSTTPPLQPAADWQRLLRVALLGTRQTAEAAPTIDLGQPGSGKTDPDYREKQVLLAAGGLSLIRKAGFQPPVPALPNDALPTAPAETLPALGPLGAQLLQQMLEGTYTTLLSGFLSDLHQHGRRVPYHLLVHLLTHAHSRPNLYGSVTAVLGQRGLWLAAQNPAWQAITEAGQATDEAAWETGTTRQRVRYLEALRRTRLEQARDLLAAALPQEPAKNQALLLATLHESLSATDTALLEQYLASKSKEVREAARLLLARVPGSPLVERVWQRTEPLLRLKSTLLNKKLLVELPEAAWDKAWLADGIEQRDARFQGYKAALLGQLLALLPPQRWATHWNLAPAKILNLAADTEWAALLFNGWAEAAILHHDTTWSKALLQWLFELPRKQPFTLPLAGLVQQLSPEQSADLLLPLLDAAPTFGPDVRWLPLLQLVPEPWPARLTRRVVAVLRDSLSHPERLHRIHYAASQLLEHMARVVPAAQHDLCAQPLQPLLGDVPYVHNSLARLLNTLNFRQQLTEALHEPPGQG